MLTSTWWIPTEAFGSTQSYEKKVWSQIRPCTMTNTHTHTHTHIHTTMTNAQEDKWFPLNTCCGWGGSSSDSVCMSSVWFMTRYLLLQRFLSPRTPARKNASTERVTVWIAATLHNAQSWCVRQSGELSEKYKEKDLQSSSNKHVSFGGMRVWQDLELAELFQNMV